MQDIDPKAPNYDRLASYGKPNFKLPDQDKRLAEWDAHVAALKEPKWKGNGLSHE